MLDLPIADRDLVEFTTGGLAGLVVLGALLRAPAVATAVLLLAAGRIGFSFAFHGVPGVLADAELAVAYVLSYPTFFKGVALGKLLAGLLHARSCRERRPLRT